MYHGEKYFLAQCSYQVEAERLGVWDLMSDSIVIVTGI